MPPNFEYLLREFTPQVLGIITRRCRDFAAAAGGDWLEPGADLPRESPLQNCP